MSHYRLEKSGDSPAARNQRLDGSIPAHLEWPGKKRPADALVRAAGHLGWPHRPLKSRQSIVQFLSYQISRMGCQDLSQEFAPGFYGELKSGARWLEVRGFRFDDDPERVCGSRVRLPAAEVSAATMETLANPSESAPKSCIPTSTAIGVPGL